MKTWKDVQGSLRFYADFIGGDLINIDYGDTLPSSIGEEVLKIFSVDDLFRFEINFTSTGKSQEAIPGKYPEQGEAPYYEDNRHLDSVYVFVRGERVKLSDAASQSLFNFYYDEIEKIEIDVEGE